MKNPDEKWYTQEASKPEPDVAPEQQLYVPPPRKNMIEIVLPILRYVGLIGACITTVAYIIAVIMLIMGFSERSVIQTLVFAVINAVVGLLILQFLKIQGISFASEMPENKALLDEYYRTKTKDKKVRSIKYYWIVSLIKDISIKGVMLAATTVGIVYVVIEASRDAALLLMAFANLLLFVCFGLLAMNAAYVFFNTRHMQYISEKINEVKSESIKEEKETEKCSETKTVDSIEI